MVRALIILLALMTGFHGVFSGAGLSVLCLGHPHASAEVGACESHCSHQDDGWPVPVPANDHDQRCDCTDVRLAAIDLAAARDGADVIPSASAAPAAGGPIFPLRASALRPAPTGAPPWNDPGKKHRMALVSSVRLTI